MKDKPSQLKLFQKIVDISTIFLYNLVENATI